MPDDFAAGIGTSGAIAIGGSATGRIEESGDQDWFATDLVGGHTYRISLDNTGTTSGLRDPYFRGIYNSSGALLAGTTNDDGGPGLNSLLEFTAPSTGRYFLSAGAFSTNTGDYVMRIEDIGALDDFPDNSTTGGFVFPGETATGEIEEASDQDWFRTELQAGRTYRIEVRGNPTSDGTLSDPYLRGIFDADGNAIPGTTNDDGGAGLNSLLEFTPTTSGIFFVSAGAYSSHTGTYQVAVTDLGSLDDHPDGVGTTGEVAVDGSVTGEIEEGGDIDWFRVTLEAGHEYTIELRGNPTSDGTLGDPYLRGVFDADGNSIAGTTNDDGGTGLNSLLTFTATTGGTFFIAAGAYGGSTGTYTLAVQDEGSADDFGSDTATAGSIPSSGVVTGEINEANDTDWFGIDMVAGHTYRIALNGAYGGGGTLSDPYLRGIHDSSGTLIPGTTNDDGGGGLDSLLEFTPASSGRYFIAAGAFSTHTGTYTLQVEDLGAADDFSDDTGTTGAAVVDGSVTGAIETGGDHDWFRVNLTAGTTYNIDLEGAPTGKGTLPDTLLYGLRDASGNLIPGTTNDDGGTGLNSHVEFTAASSGIYYVDVGAYGANEGTYTLSIAAERTVTDDFSAGTDTTGSVSVGGSRTGNIEAPSDQDWFRVSLVAGHTYQVDLEGSPTSGGTLSDPYFRGLYNSSGALVSGTTNDDGGTGLNSQITFTADSTGTFFLAAGAYGSNTGTYKISLADLGAADDFAGDTSTTGSAPVGGAVTGNIESAGDQDWFRVNLTEGNTYQIDLEGSATTSETLRDPLLAGVFDGAGNLISGTRNDDGGTGLNSLVEFTPTTTGSFFIGASAYGSNTGTYKLSVTQTSTGGTGGPADDFSETTATAGRVTVGGSSTGNIETIGDNDWFSVTLNAGQTYTIDLEGTATGGGTLADPYIRGIFNASGAAIPGAFNDDGGTGRNAQLEFTPTTTGTYFISAGAYSGTGTYKVSVSGAATTPPPTSGFDIDIVFSGDERYRSVFENAAATWEAVITGDLPDVNDPRFGIVDDLRIDASVVAIDGPGRILGQAGPRDLRAGSGLTYNGMMQFDSADLAGMEAKGILQDVIEHEMGHVLGLGTLWQRMGLKSGFTYNGTNAIREFSALTGRTETSVPLENTGGPGTAGGHWLESLFRTELMTGYAENAPPMPLSRLTIASLQDMGYVVNYAAAEPYSLPTGGAAVLAGGESDETPTPSVVSSGIAAVIDPDGFSGQRYVNLQDKPLSITATPDPVKLDGRVTSASETTVLFFETTTGSDYLVELTGNFDKNNPTNGGDVKGTLTQLTLFASGAPVARYTFDTPVDVETALNEWRDFDLSGDNLLENRSATAENDLINGLAGDDFIIGGLGDDTMDGGEGTDTVGFDVDVDDVTVTRSGDTFTIVSSQGSDQATGFESFQFADHSLTLAEMTALADGGSAGRSLTGTPEADVLQGGSGDDTITGLDGNDRLLGEAGNDSLDGGLGADTLNGGDGNDIIIGGPGEGDLRDVIFAGEGNDSVDAGAGNDLIFGQGGNDTIAGGFGVDEIQGQDGDDVITGSAFSDLVFGGAGNDFVNGGFGHDRINGGTGADKFFHVGVEGHGSDWVQDYSSAEGDVLLFGNTAATRADFQVNFAHTANAEGERSGDDDVMEAFVIYRPTEQIMWALVDGQGQDSINLQIGADVFDLLT
ncbi:pre-peptidase C-terminal domain-containing protein [Ruegeria aquimaris]|uniref:Pre-peptidase C-terminal domain-containing protein n=1 Tax=Ruegeria aquimaris TaxID=2984333 RepID=A0ABT3AJG3_9RHOB|nr:pre-peptidase C-terminal domain-containing protein [Ruegeria sp. XHP0148]MCV2888457.1 pre-peptidase C-terminal domain-containing protein [Ruegeria sp. XHP0148]